MRIRIAVLLCCCWMASAADVANRPNIVLVFTDDLGWKDVAYQGSDFIETPHLDALAKQGVIFSDAYACAGNCAPSRACLLSGMYTPRHGLFAVGSTDRGPKTQQRLIPIPNKDGLTPKAITVAEVLKQAGYVTGHFGKWHLDGKDGAKPSQQGFDVTYDSFGEGELPEGSEGNKKGPPSDPKGVFTLTKRACDFMKANKERPFFVYLAHHAIHGPLQGRPESLSHFKEKKLGAQHKNPLYAACTYDADASLGILLEFLDKEGLADNTLLVFTSDNGAVQESSQEPLRGSKGGYYEGGIRVPMIIRWPGVTKPGLRCDVPVINVDLYPTFLAAAKATPPPDAIHDGEDLAPLFDGKGELKRPAIFWHFPGYLDRPVNRGRELDVKTGFRSRPVSVIRQGDWKLHLYLEEWELDGGRGALATNHAVELYNLRNDIGERQDLAATNAQKRDELLDALLAWHKSVGAQIPTEKNPAYDPTKSEKGGKIDKKGKK